jgi:hypothetical protein
MTQDAYNYENIDNCQLPEHRSATSEPYPGDVVHALNRGINRRTDLSDEIQRLQKRLRELEDFELRARRKGGVFVSYSHQDSDFVDRLVECFERDEINYWRDNKDILAGQVIDKAISQGIQKNWIFLLVLTETQISHENRPMDKVSMCRFSCEKMGIDNFFYTKVGKSPRG